MTTASKGTGGSKKPHAGTSSWREEIQKIEADKLKTHPSGTPKVVQRTRHQGRGWLDPEQAKLDPILQAPVNPGVHERLVTSEKEKLIQSVNRGFIRDLSHRGVEYDIVNFQTAYRLPRDKLVSLKQKEWGGVASRKSGLKQLSRAVAEASDSKGLLTFDPHAPVSAPSPKRPPVVEAQKAREFNIISGDYYANNAERKAAKEAALKQRLAEKFSATRKFHPILGTYYDASKESEVSGMEKTLLDSKKDYHTSGRAPLSVAKSEGHAYNIVSGSVVVPDKARRFESLALRGVLPRTQFRARLQRYCDASQAHAEADAQRALARKAAAPAVRRQHVAHGYDILTNEPFGPPTSAAPVERYKMPLVPLSVLRVETVGSKLQKLAATNPTVNTSLAP